ncbi:DL-endopeptidase inhibitor IseA family protein [Sporosarcina sp. 179-K 3D1 HS]|uniref:DL-endopeptidase inhibitor IseA family protein n=1 Tax=Sporosarcina sp. 179-K 3D1 HS TaxID=3232169 RepID=UPI0039A099C7
MEKVWMMGLALLAVVCFSFQGAGMAASKHNGELTPEKAVELAANWDATKSLVQAGGNYKEGEYKSFTYKGTPYRFMAGHLDRQRELMAELEKSLTKKGAKQYVKDSGFIKYKGKIAQIEADGGSLLEWNKAKAKELTSSKNKKVFQLNVPIAGMAEAEIYQVTYEYVNKTGWRLSQLPVLVTK